jgi:hypothetical protein
MDVWPGSTSFVGAVFDGKFVYFIPYYANTRSIRFDTTHVFQDQASWESFDLTSIDGGVAAEYAGGVFDGRHVYYVPFGGTPIAARFDTEAGAFDAPNARERFDLSTFAPRGHFFGGAFDGRYVYFVPNYDFVGGALGLIVRYDSQQSFAEDGAWSSFDLATLNQQAANFAGAIFDGRYLYLVPNAYGVVARFDAREPSSLPPGPAHGSFY